jgi:hypothetical protein
MSDPTPTPTPLELDAVDTQGTYYGVRIAMLGEDGDRCLAFTHARRRAIAATRRHIREEYSERASDIGPANPSWVQIFDKCGCAPDVENPGDDCDHWGLPPCQDVYGWASARCKPSDLNALAVIELEWDC